MNNEQTIKELYAAFQQGDVAAIVAKVADDVDWRNDQVASNECPWNGKFSGGGPSDFRLQTSAFSEPPGR